MKHQVYFPLCLIQNCEYNTALVLRRLPPSATCGDSIIAHRQHIFSTFKNRMINTKTQTTIWFKKTAQICDLWTFNYVLSVSLNINARNTKMRAVISFGCGTLPKDIYSCKIWGLLFDGTGYGLKMEDAGFTENLINSCNISHRPIARPWTR